MVLRRIREKIEKKISVKLIEKDRIDVRRIVGKIDKITS
jgi:hypothetical protein